MNNITMVYARWIALALALLVPGTAAGTEYRISPGDTVEIVVARIPELQRRVTVKLDGTIAFPFLGTLPVAGLTQAQLQVKVQAGLATKVFQRTTGGRDDNVAIDADEVTATIAEYRPIYVDGDVSKPGEYPYRPQMTIRQAVAVAGGYDLIHFRAANPVLEWAGIQSEYETLWMEFAKEQAHVARLKAELADRSEFDRTSLSELPLPRPTADEIANIEAAQLDTHVNDQRKQKEFLQRGVAQAREEIDVLSRQQRTEEQGAQADIEELQKMVELYGKGALPSPRVTDARRAVLLSSTRKLQTLAQLMQTKRQQDDMARQLERVDEQRRIELLHELQDATVRLAQIRAQLEGVADKLQYTAILKSRLANGAGYKPRISLIRNSDKTRQHQDANEDSELEPGDVIEISLRSAVLPEASATVMGHVHQRDPARRD
jgi:polysaccharide biosynthesis/export protein